MANFKLKDPTVQVGLCLPQLCYTDTVVETFWGNSGGVGLHAALAVMAAYL